jgi:hypothetical protein
MTPVTEVLAGELGGDFSIKLQAGVLITEHGSENVMRNPFDAI